MRSYTFLPVPFLLAVTVTNAQCTLHNALTFRSPVTTFSGLTAIPISANLTTPRGIAFDSNQNLLVVERGFGITAFTENDPSCAGWLRTVVLTHSGLTQGIQVDGQKLYVSTSGQVLRYQYDPTTKSVGATPVVVVSGIPPDGELTTRPILLNPPSQPTEILVGSSLEENIDPTARDPSSGRSQVRSFTLSQTNQDFFSGELLAYGIRNPAAFAFFPPTLSSKKLWILDNGASIDNVIGLTSAFVNDNPADELNYVGLLGQGEFYGFPDCTTIWNPSADPVGDPQYTDLHTGDQFSLNLEAERDDAWCRDASNNVPPRLSFQAHSVPLDLKFYIPGLKTKKGALPPNWTGDAFVSFHGSFNRAPPTGYGVVRVPFTLLQPSSPPLATDGYSFLVQATNLNTCPGTCIRPVGLAFHRDGRLFVSSDTSGELFYLSSQ